MFRPSSLTEASRLNLASVAGSTGDPSRGSNHALRSAEMISASVRVSWGSLMFEFQNEFSKHPN